MSNTFTIFRGHAYTYRPGTPEGPTTKAIAYLAYSGRDKLFVVKAVNEHGKTRCLLRATDFNEAVKYYEAEFPGIGAKRDEFNNPNKSWEKFSTSINCHTLLSYLKEWKDTLVKDQTHHTDWERNHDNYNTEPRPTPPAINFHTETYEDASLENAAKKFERGCRNSFESGYFLPRYPEDSPKLPVGEGAFSKIKEQFPKAYVWLEELGVNMPLKKIPIKLHRGHVGNKNQAHSAFFVAEKQGRFYYVPFCTLGKRGSREFATLKEAEKYYKTRCPHGVDSGQLVKDAYGARTPVSAHEFQQILSSLNHPWAGKEFEMQWGVFTDPPVPKMKKELVMGHIWGAPGKPREVVLVTRRGSCYVVMEKTSGSSELVSIGHVHSLSEANKILDVLYPKRPHKEGEFLRLDWNSSAPIRPSVFLQEIAEILPDSEFLKTHELTPVKKTPEKLEEATPKEQEREKLGDFKPELNGWSLSGAAIQAESRYNGAFLLWRRQLSPGRQEYGVQALGFPQGGGPDLYATTSLTDAIAHAHQVCRSQRIYHERRGESRKLDGINDFGVGISNLQDTITINRTAYNIDGAHITPTLSAYKEKSAEAERVLDILTEARAVTLQEAERIGRETAQLEASLTGTALTAPPLTAASMAPTAGEMMQKQIEAMKTLGVSTEEMKGKPVTYAQAATPVVETTSTTSSQVLVWDGVKWKEQVMQQMQRSEDQRQHHMGLADPHLPKKPGHPGHWSFDRGLGCWIVEDQNKKILGFYGENLTDFETIKEDSLVYTIWDPETKEFISIPRVQFIQRRAGQPVRDPEAQRHDMKNFKRSKEGEQTMATTPNPKNPALENVVPAVLTESQRTILDKYQDEAKAIDLEKAIKDMEMLKAEHDKALAQAKGESRKLKTTKKKRATMMQTMSLSAVFTLLTYLVLARVFGRPVPNLQLTQPKRRLRKGKRRHREEEVSEPIAALLPPRAEEVPPQGSKTRNRSKVRA